MNREDPIITYDMIRNTAPKMPASSGKKRRLRVWHILLFFAAVMAIFLIFGGALQYYLGMWGVLAEQAGFFFLSVLFVKLMRADMREVFPVKKPKAAGLGGVLVAWTGVFLATQATTYLLLMIAPEATLSVSGSMNDLFFGSPSQIITVLIVSLAPAVCEEAMHRGVILNGFRNDLGSRKWLVIICSGAIFGLFHLYPVRFIPTALIGCLMAYLVVTTNNMVYSAFLHLIHNGLLMLLSVAALSAVGDGVLQQSADMISSIPKGMYGIPMAIFGAPAPILLYAGCFLVRRVTAPIRPRFLPPGRERQTLLLIFGITFGIAAAGVLCAALIR